MPEGSTLPFQLFMNTNQFKDNASWRDAHLLNRPQYEARLVTKGGCIHLELVPPTEQEQEFIEDQPETTDEPINY